MNSDPTGAPRRRQTYKNLALLTLAFLGSLAFYGLFIFTLTADLPAILRPAPEPHPGLRDDALKTALRNDRTHAPLSYFQARHALWNSIDGDGRRAIGTYTGDEIKYFKQPLPNTGAVEHAWPLTRLPREARSDLHHMFAATGEARAARLNLHYGPVKVAVWARGGSRSGPGHKLKPVFEVRPDTRGDIARAVFYVATMYQLNLPADEERTLRQWHREDPPDKAEKMRNDRISSLQKSRNPFIDYPNLVERISSF